MQKGLRRLWDKNLGVEIATDHVTFLEAGRTARSSTRCNRTYPRCWRMLGRSLLRLAITK